MISVNRRAASIAVRMIEECEALGIAVRKLKNGAAVLDGGIEAAGSLEAGRLFACACMGGLAQVGFGDKSYPLRDSSGDAGFWLPTVTVSVSSPPIACMASQYAGWAVKTDTFSAMGSGPARALFADEGIFRKLGYRDECDTAVLMLEGRSMPDEDLAEFVADKCGVAPDRVFLFAAPTASLVGSIQIAARSAETGMHKLLELGFDVRKVKAASGVCPLAPVSADDARAIGRTNDAILYGSQVFFAVEAEDGELAGMIDKVPSDASPDYGTPFDELLRRCGGDFYRIDPMLFSPARIAINNLNSGRTFRSGSINAALLKRSLLES
ncbi:MAG: methenyltetrahydromethanopterin cyclohydrolase [Acidobacteria bacterium]|nr:methenyltetrahydromethanopterin cyclohydrolase [Acidobacteriota bacterium]